MLVNSVQPIIVHGLLNYITCDKEHTLKNVTVSTVFKFNWPQLTEHVFLVFENKRYSKGLR
jgi:hypothetical protein